MPLAVGVEAVDCSSAVGRGASGVVEVPSGLAVRELTPLPPPSLLPSKTFKLLSSLPSSLSRFSLPSRAPWSALGIASFSDLTSSLIRRASSSRLREAVFRSPTTSSTSFKAVSRRSVRVSSADFSADVSVDSCSIKAKARENCSSMCALSCSNCGGVGGATRGAIYRYSEKTRTVSFRKSWVAT